MQYRPLESISHYMYCTCIALVQGGQISCLQPSELAWYDWSRLCLEAALRAVEVYVIRLIALPL